MKMKNKDIAEKIVFMSYEDTKDFLLNDTKNWKGKNGSFISYGLLNAVFETIFSLAPSKGNAMEIVSMSLSNFLEEEEEGGN
jgi:hypothetical protein